MLFNSFTFVIFCLITFGLYYLPVLRRAQVSILIIASFVFYGWEMPKLLALLLFSILLNTGVSFTVAKTDGTQKRRWAVFGIVANLILLGLFKYGALLTNLILQLTKTNADPTFALLHIPLPIGISFYTFEGISLLVDVLRGASAGTSSSVVVAPRFREHLSRTALFVAFYPHLVAGPILKARHFYPQIKPKQFRDIPWESVFRSLVIGYFLKVVVADNLKDYTYWITYPFFEAQGSITLIVMLFGYSMQIFADFAGYSLIAIGVAAAFGYELPANFNFPYVSRSIAEFWRRWHISLSTWLRDYLYFPLGGNRKGPVRTYVNLLVVMLLGGLWHGAAWSFAVWGLYHGLGLAIERGITDLRERSVNNQTSAPSKPYWWQFTADLIRVGLVFSFVSLGWLLFKLQNIQEAFRFLVTLAHNLRVAPAPMIILPILVYSIPVVVYHARHFPLWEERVRVPLSEPQRQGTRSAIFGLAYALMLALLCLNSGTSNAFIYFQF